MLFCHTEKHTEDTSTEGTIMSSHHLLMRAIVNYEPSLSVGPGSCLESYWDILFSIVALICYDFLHETSLQIAACDRLWVSDSMLSLGFKHV